MKSIDIEECHKILLNIAFEFHKICIENNIPYYMLGGTMLGAIRHKGFIPWDDDMDFGIPRKYFKQFAEVANLQKSENIKINTHQSTSYISTDAIKMSDVRTIIVEQGASCVEEMGINIDIFPLDDATNDVSLFSDNSKAIYIQRFNRYTEARLKDLSFKKKIFALLVKLLKPTTQDEAIDVVNNISLRNLGATCFANYYGFWGLKEVITKEIFGTPTLYTFETLNFYGPQYYDAYLKQLYNDYMQLPPKDKRHTHLEKIYWK